MKSAGDCEPLDLGRLLTTDADVRALARVRQQPPLATTELLAALARLRPSREALRARKGPGGSEPFRL